jgi:hypothetical protein
VVAFDLMLFLDVLEHVADDHAFLKEMVGEALAPGGTIVVSVPAWQGLFGKHDEALKHYRRYSPRTLRAMLSNAGLEVTNSGGIFHTLLVVPRDHSRGRAHTPLVWTGNRSGPQIWGSGGEMP